MKKKNEDLTFDLERFIDRNPVAETHPEQKYQCKAPDPTTGGEITEGMAKSTQQTEFIRRISSKQRKASLAEYREQLLKPPRIIDRQPVFISRTTRDGIDEIVRKLGERRMSVSGFLENLANNHLNMYKEDLEEWKKL